MEARVDVGMEGLMEGWVDSCVERWVERMDGGMG